MRFWQLKNYQLEMRKYLFIYFNFNVSFSLVKYLQMNIPKYQQATTRVLVTQKSEYSFPALLSKKKQNYISL